MNTYSRSTVSHFKLIYSRAHRNPLLQNSTQTWWAIREKRLLNLACTPTGMFHKGRKILPPNISKKRNQITEALWLSLEAGLCLLSELQMETEWVEGKDGAALRHQTQGERENEQRILPAAHFKGLQKKRHKDRLVNKHE